jgi:hypothetical protein
MVTSSTITRLAACWCALQASGITVWWLALVWHPPLRTGFLVPGSGELTLFAFALPDAVLGVVGGVLACIGLLRGRTWGRDALLLVTGAMVYAALWCVVVGFAGGGWWGAALMLPSLVAMPWLCWRTPR